MRHFSSPCPQKPICSVLAKEIAVSKFLEIVVLRGVLWALGLCDFSQPSVRKTHCSGRKHKENVKDYYQKWMEEQAQSLIDKTSKTNPFVILVCFAFASVFKCFPSFFPVLIQHNFPGYSVKHKWKCDLESELIPAWSLHDRWSPVWWALQQLKF